EIRQEAVLATTEIDEVFLEVGELGAVKLRELFREVRRDISQRELAFVVMAEIIPVALDVNLVAVKAVEADACSVILLRQLLEIRQRLRAEVIQLWRLVGNDNQH